MIFPRIRPLALGCGLLLAAAAPAAADQPANPTPPAEEPAKQPAPESTEAPAEDAGNTADARICRYVRLDMSSRRKTKVCRTTEEWRELGNPR